MQLKSPQKTFVPAPPDNGCACNECPFMKLNTLEKLYVALRDLSPRDVWRLTTVLFQMPMRYHETAARNIAANM